jgi:hypothetical protein
MTAEGEISLRPPFSLNGPLTATTMDHDLTAENRTLQAWTEEPTR